MTVQNVDGYNKLVGLGYSAADAATAADAAPANPNFYPSFANDTPPAGFTGTYRSSTGQDVQAGSGANSTITSGMLNSPKVTVPTPSATSDVTTLGQTVGKSNADTMAGLKQSQVDQATGLVSTLFGNTPSGKDTLDTLINNSGMKESQAKITELRNQIALQNNYLNAGLSKIGDETIATPIIGRQQRLLSDQQGRKITLLSAQLEAEQGNYNMAKDLVNMQYEAWKSDSDRQFQIKSAVLQQLDKYENYNLDVAKMKIENDYTQSNKLEDTRRQILTNYYQSGGKSGSIATAIGSAKNFDELMAAGGAFTQTALEKAQLQNARLSNLKIQQDLTTGKVPTIKSINGVDMQWDPATKAWIPAVTSGATPNVEKLSESQSNIQQVNDLLKSGGLGASVGTNFTNRTPRGFWGSLGAVASVVGIPSFFRGVYKNATGEQQNFLAGVQQLQSQLSLDSLIKAKAQGATFGALSDSEMKILSSSASKLGGWAHKDSEGNIDGYNASEKDFKAELDKINNFAKLDYVLKGGTPEDIGLVQQPDGTWWSKNSNGSYTRIK